MTSIFIGMILLFLNFNMNLGSDLGIINLIPDFIGYMFLLMGFRELGEKYNCETLRKTIPALFGGFAVSVIYFATNILALNGYLSFALEMIGQVFFYWCTWQLVKGLKAIEADIGQPLDAAVLDNRWRYLFVTSLVMYLLYVPGMLFSGVFISTIILLLMVVTVIFHIRLLLTLNKT